jgi:hypothetical protein
MLTPTHVLIPLIAVVVYIVVCVVKAEKRCGRCKGTPGRSRRYVVAGPVVKCRKCSGHKKHPRFGATFVHWFIWSAIVDPLRERRDRHDSGPRFSYAPAYRPAGLNAGQLRAAQRAERLLAFQARLQARTAHRAWQFA